MNELINVTVEDINGILVTTSNRVAEELEVNHKDLLEKIDAYIAKFSSAESSAQFYIPSEYKTLNNRTVRNYLITEKGIAQLIGGYSSAVPKAFDLNVAYINEFERMKHTLNQGIKIPKTLKEALLIALEQEEKLEALKTENAAQAQKISEDKPKVFFADAVSASSTSILISELAKLLKQNGYNTGQKRLFEQLRKEGYLMKTGSSENVPTQMAMNKGLFEIKESTIVLPNKVPFVTKTTKITGKGQQYFINKYLGANNEALEY